MLSVLSISFNTKEVLSLKMHVGNRRHRRQERNTNSHSEKDNVEWKTSALKGTGKKADSLRAVHFCI